MKRLVFYFFIYFLVQNTILGQIKRDPRSVAMANAYTTIADGFFAVGYNPAMIAYQQDKPFMLQLFGFDMGLSGNFISLENLNSLSGDTLYAEGENPRNPNDNSKDRLFRQFEDAGGLAFAQDIHLPLPIINYSSGNMAFTSNLVWMSNLVFPTGILELLFYGNGQRPEMDMTFNVEVFGVNELGFTFAVPYDRFAIGVTVKYLQGLFYFGVDPDSSRASMVTSDYHLYGSGKYLFRFGVGGSGLGLDLGFVTKEYNGFRAGVALINALGVIEWNKQGMMKDLVAGPDALMGTDDDLFNPAAFLGFPAINEYQAISYEYKIDSVNAAGLSSPDIFTSEPFKAVDNTDPDGNPKEFKTNYPAIFRAGISYSNELFIISSDLWTGFTNQFYAHAGWRWSVGFEFLKFKNIPLRLGYAFGGPTFKELGLGFGYHTGPLIFDFGFGFKNGVWIHSMQGLNLSLQLTMTSFKGRDSKPAAPSDGPAPLPEDAATDEETEEETESNGESSEEPTQDAETDSDESLSGEEKQ
jgi:hypothetical protein